MSAEDFFSSSVCPDVEEAFQDVVATALYDHGHSGYTGTVGEKSSYLIFTPTREIDPGEIYQMLLTQTLADGTKIADLFPTKEEEIVEAFDDKWGPAVALPYPAGSTYKWAFCGWASA